VGIFLFFCLLTSVFSFSFSLFCFLKNRNNPTNSTFFINGIANALWSLGLGFMSVAPTKSLADFWITVHYMGASLIPPTFAVYINTFLQTDKKRKQMLWFWWALGLVFFVLTVTRQNLFVEASPNKPFFNYYTNGGSFYPIYALGFFICIADCVVQLLKALKNHHTGITEKHVQYVLIATLIGFGGGTTAFFPVFNIRIYPFGMFVVFLYPVIMTYAIIRHRLMDIDVIIKKTLVFAGLFAAIYGVFVLLSSLGQEIFRDLFGFSQALAVIPTVIVVIFIHEPLKKFLTQATDRFLFQKKYNPAGLLRAFAREVVAEYDINQITRMTVRKLSEILRVESCAIFVPDKDKDKFILKDSVGLKDQNIFFDKKSSELCLELAKSAGVVLYPESLPLLEDLRKADARIAFAITGHNETIGILTLGPKKSDEDYGKDDVEILKSLCDALGLAINTALVFEDTIQKEKLITVGTMVAGIRHDISNPVYLADLAIQEFLMDREEGRHASIPPAEFSSRVYNLINRCRSTFQKVVAISAKFSEIARPKSNTGFLPVKLSEIVENYLSVFEYELETKKIRLQKQISADDPEIPCDRDYIEQILFNLIRNAIYAIEEAKRPEGLLCVKLYSKKDKVAIEIEDNGTGIPQDKLLKIFDSFYTTKPQGIGTGLGLAIVKELVERSNGTIRVESELGKGTKFILEFRIT